MAISNDPKAFIESHFDASWSYHFWHHLAFKYPNEITYQNELLVDKRIESINRKLKRSGGNSFDKVASGGMTPLHVAGVCKNLAAWKFLLSRGASIDVAKDDFSNKPIDYVRDEPAFWPSIFNHLKPYQFVKMIFNDPKFGYWQHAAAYNFEKEIYKKTHDVQVSTEEVNIAGMTPLHVAAICCNALAWKFFIGHNLSIFLKDEFGNTPLDYAKMYPKLLDATLSPLRPHIITTDLKKLLSEVFEKKRVQLRRSNFTYKKYTQDFGLEIKEIFRSYMPPRMASNFEKLAKNLGFKIKVLMGNSKARDCFYHRNERIITPYLKINQETLVTGDKARVTIKNESSTDSLLENGIKGANSLFCYHSALPDLRDSKLRQIFGDIKTEQVVKDNPSLLSVRTNPPSKFYFEGRNQMTVTTQNGSLALFGEQTIMANFRLLGLKSPVNEYYVLNLVENLPIDDVDDIQKEMYEFGYLEIQYNKNPSGLIDLKKFKSFDDILTVIQKEPYNILPSQPMNRGNFKILKQAKELVARYSYHKNETIRAIAEQMGVKLTNVKGVSPVLYPLNNYIRPGPKGSLFILDFELCGDICESLLKNAKLLNLSDEDIGHLKIYKSSAQKRHQEAGSFLSDAAEILKSQGFELIPFPGYFSYDTKENNRCFNFMNFLSGWSANTKKYYLINGGITVGDQLGRVFMDVFACFMHQYIKEDELDLHFIGQSKNSSDFFENMDEWNREDLLGGVYDKTFESKTENHIHLV